MKELKVSFIIIGAIIGAGFASGKEIFEYFAKYGKCSFFFIPVLFFCFYIFIRIYLIVGNSNKNISIINLNQNLSKSSKIFNRNFSYLNFFMFSTFLILSSAMFSGIIALIETYFPTANKFWAYLIVVVFSLLTIKLAFKTLSVFSYIVVPIIIVSIIICSVFSLTQATPSNHNYINNILPLPILTIAYASQNTFLSSFAIIQLGSDLNKRQQKKVSLYVSTILCLILSLGILCFTFNPYLGEFNMPFAEISKAINPAFSIVFGFIILGAIITTYITTISSLKEYFKGNKKYNKQVVMIVLIVLLSLFEFETIIEYLYPIIGIFGIIYCYRCINFTNLSFKPLFKSSNNRIHSTSKNAKNNRAG